MNQEFNKCPNYNNNSFDQNSHIVMDAHQSTYQHLPYNERSLFSEYFVVITK